MTRGRTRRAAELLSTSAFGALYGWSRRRAWRKLRRLHASRPGPWLVRDGKRWLVNVSLLRASHPGFFDAPEASDLEERLSAAEDRVARLELRDRAKGAAIRALAKRLAVLEDGTQADVRPFSVNAEPAIVNHGMPASWVR